MLFSETFWTNPQYRVEVTDPDEGDDDNAGTIIVGLMQKERRKKRKEGIDLLTMGYAIYQVRLHVVYNDLARMSKKCILPVFLIIL